MGGGKEEKIKGGLVTANQVRDRGMSETKAFANREHHKTYFIIKSLCPTERRVLRPS
jgi:hypothetical protein